MVVVVVVVVVLSTHHCPLLTPLLTYSLLATLPCTDYSLLTVHCSLPSACLTAHHLPLIRFDRSRQGAPTFVCSHHGKRACVDMRMLEVAAAVVRQRSTITLEAVGASTLDEECLRFGEFTGLLEDQSRRFRVVGDGCGDCEPEEDNTIQPPGPIEYDIKIRAATLKALQHPTADNLNSTAVVAQDAHGVPHVITLRDTISILQDNLWSLIRKARRRSPGNDWLSAVWPDRELVEDRPSEVWKCLAAREDMSCLGCEEPTRPSRTQWMSSSNGELYPFHPQWQVVSRK